VTVARWKVNVNSPKSTSPPHFNRSNAWTIDS
jgi:hypothetical protein